MSIHVHAVRTAVAAVLLAVAACPSLAATGQTPEGRALERALKLLPGLPNAPVRMLDPDLVANPEAVRGLDAFVVRETDGRLRPVIYINVRSRVVENAVRGGVMDVAILAAVVLHEDEHLRGASERQALTAEREFFRALVLAGKVPTDEALSYMQQLDRHARREAP